jgi:hypothetical protein
MNKKFTVCNINQGTSNPQCNLRKQLQGTLIIIITTTTTIINQLAEHSVDLISGTLYVHHVLQEDLK